MAGFEDNEKNVSSLDELLGEFSNEYNNGEPIEKKEAEEEEPETDDEGGNEDTVTDEETNEVDDTTPDAEEEDDSKDETKDEEDHSDEPEDKSNQAFAKMRVENKELAKYKQVVENIAAAQGTDAETLLSQLSEAALKRRADNQGIDPKILKRLEDVEAENAKLREERETSTFIAKVDKLKNSFKLKDAEVKTFMEFLQQRGMNPLNPALDFETLYRGYNYDALVNQAQKDAKQEVIVSRQKAKEKAGTVPEGTQKRKSNKKQKIESQADFNALVDSLSKK